MRNTLIVAGSFLFALGLLLGRDTLFPPVEATAAEGCTCICADHQPRIIHIEGNTINVTVDRSRKASDSVYEMIPSVQNSEADAGQKGADDPGPSNSVK